MANSAGEKNTIRTDYLTIEGNMLKWSDTIIQISNISILSTSNVAKIPFPMINILFIVVGVAAIIIGEIGIGEIGVAVGIALLVIALIWILSWYDKKTTIAEMQILSISMNSGINYMIVFNNKAFLKKVMNLFARLLSETEHKENITINIKGNTFSGSAQVIGSVNE